MLSIPTIRECVIAAARARPLGRVAPEATPDTGVWFLPFQYPQSGDTLPSYISDSLAVTGEYTGGNSPGRHGFVSWPPFSYLSFDPDGSKDTVIIGITLAGTIAGYYLDPFSVYWGFVRDLAGNFAQFPHPDSLGTYHPGTKPNHGSVTGINDLGFVTGYSMDEAGFKFGFVRDAQGIITQINPPPWECNGTMPSGINVVGVITGVYINTDNGYNGFVRDAQGNMKTFDPTGSVETVPTAINAFSEITGTYLTKDEPKMHHGFARDFASGTVTTFDPRGSVDTLPASINVYGDITGSYKDANGVVHGFVRYRQTGEITSFDAPNSFGTRPTSIDDWGIIVGNYDSAYQGPAIGFARVP